MKKRSVTIAGHATSISLEEEFWQELQALAAAHGTSVNALIAQIDEQRGNNSNLSSAIRVYILGALKGALKNS